MTNVWSCERMRGFFRVDQLTAAGETQEKQLWQKFSTFWSTNYYRHLFWWIVRILFFISRFYSMSGKVSVSAALPLSYLFQTGALETRIVNCTVFSQTHAEFTKKWVNHFLPNLNHNQWPCVLFRGGLRKQLWEEIFFSAGTGRERSEKTQTHLQNSHHRSACGLRYLVVLFTSNHSCSPSSHLSEHLLCL